MANAFYAPGDRRAARVRDLFGGIARRYDLVNDVQSFGLHRWWKRQVVRRAQVRPGQRALDLCCGTGDLAWRLARAGGAVAGLDFSGPMLAVARARQAPGPLGRRAGGPAWLRGDALRLPFADASFDVVTIGYGLRNLADFTAGLTEMWRVLRPGGRLLVLDFGKPEWPVWRAVYFAYLRWVVPGFGWLCGGSAEAYAYILTSLEPYPAQCGVAEGMRQLGAARLEIVRWLGGAMSLNYGEKPVPGAGPAIAADRPGSSADAADNPGCTSPPGTARPPR